MPTAPSDLIDYADWGERFFSAAVTVERVLDGVNVLAGRPLEVGPLGVGPGRVARARAVGRIGSASGTRSARSPLTFDVTLPVSLELVLDLGVDRQRFDAEVVVPLTITAHARADLAIVIDVDAPSAGDEVSCELRSRGLRASLTNRVADVAGELRRFAARYVTRELESPYIRQAMVIDVAAAVDRAAEQVTPRAAGQGAG